MKKSFLSIVLALCLLSSLSVTAHAEHFTGKGDWHVAFTPEEVMDSNFKTTDFSAQVNDPVDGLQPGDDITFNLSLENQHSATTDWYMTNEVIKSLENESYNDSTHGGAYTYRLVYTNAAGEDRVLFDSDMVGGDDVSKAGEGLNEATSALKDYFYLDTLTSGQKGEIKLTVALDGETQGNDYQDTLAKVKMNFAVELNSTPDNPTPPNRTTVVKTGDESNLLPYYAAMIISGVLFLILGIGSVKKRKKEEDAA